MPRIGVNITTNSRAALGSGLRLGADIVTNGNFATDTDWTKGTGWTIAGGVAVATNVGSAAQLLQGMSFTSATTFRARIEVSGYTGGVCQIWMSGIYSGVEINGNGVFIAEVTTPDPVASFVLSLQGYTNFTADLDNITVRPIL